VGKVVYKEISSKQKGCLNDIITIRLARTDNDIAQCAKLLSTQMYTPDTAVKEIPKGQLNELYRLEVKDLTDRYRSNVNNNKNLFPSSLIVAVENEEIIGCVGLDVQLLNTNEKNVIKPKSNLVKTVMNEVNYFQDNENIKCGIFLANLVVRKDKRRLGLGKELINACETAARDDFFVSYPNLFLKSIFLLVDQRNKNAQMVYRRNGYSTYFINEDATCVVSGDYGLQTQDCVNLCMKKDVKSSSSSSGGDIFTTFFNSIFKR
jgi:ribosomal protein S18 acetylase RimI-like enzyme